MGTIRLRAANALTLCQNRLINVGMHILMVVDFFIGLKSSETETLQPSIVMIPGSVPWDHAGPALKYCVVNLSC